MYKTYSTENSKSVSLVALIVAISFAFMIGFGALCFATNAGQSDTSGNPLKQTQNTKQV